MVGLAIVIVTWGLNFVVMKWGLRGLSPMLMGALRFAVAALPFFFLRRPAMPWPYLVGYGLTQGFGQFGCLFLGLQLGMPAGLASVVMQTQAFFTLLIGIPLLHEKTKPSQWLGLIVALGGLTAIACAHGNGVGEMTLIGFVLTVGAALMWAVANVVGRMASKSHAYDAVNFIAWTSLVPVAPFLLLACWMDSPQQVWTQLVAIRTEGLLVVLYLGLASTLLAYGLWTRLLQRHAAAQVAPWSLLVPVVGLTAAALAFGEQPLPLQWAGVAAVFAGLVINQGAAWFRR